MIDEATLSQELSQMIASTEPTPLASAGPPSRPGVYLLLYTGDLALYARITRRWPIYAGSAESLSGRMCDHRASLRGVKDLSVEDFAVATIAAGSPALAKYLEALAMDLFHPVWNEPRLAGFGSHFQGSARAGQRRPAWSVVHPGRRCGSGAPLRTRRELIKIAKEHLAATVPADGSAPFAI
jgi:hypothetical protein